MRKIFKALCLLSLSLTVVTGVHAESFKKSNLVCFVKFADETDDNCFEDHDFAHYETLFNGTETGANTVYNYFKQASYGKLDWTSVFFPAPSGTKIMSYTAQNERSYYEPTNHGGTGDNKNGYDRDDATAMAARERALVKEIIAYLNENIGADAVIDADNDGIVDNLTFIFSGSSDVSARYLLWPKRADLVSATNEFVIRDKKVVGYIMTFDASNGFDMSSNIPINTGVLCHEMSHALGTYDLYHVNDKLNPVGIWDLMSDNQPMAQNMTVYTKWRYCKWLNEEYVDGIPLISEPGTYTLNPVGGNTSANIAYKIQPVGSNEYFVVEYRKKEGFDSSLPESGLIVYRINPSYSGGNVNYNGTTRLDEQYVFRPGGTTTADGDISKAAFSADNGRTAFGGLADQKPFYSDGTVANFAIANISAAGETISFDLLEATKQLMISDTIIVLKGMANSAASVTIACDDAWVISGIPDWLTLNPSTGESGSTSVTLTANEDNTTGAERTATLTVTSTVDETLTKDILVKQSAKSNSVILSDGFEDTSNPNGWVIENIGESGKGWQYTGGSTTGKLTSMVNSGTHAMTMKETFWEETHQDAKLTSPTFAGGKTLTFYSHTNGGNATPNNKPFYLVQVSGDGGATWNTLFNVLEDYPRDAEGKTVSALSYTKITLDLSPYTSENMKIRFYCYDVTNEGLQYWWQIDDLEISSEAVDTGVEKVETPEQEGRYEIYTLQGVRVAQPTKGVYIKNGKKFIVKE